jgi:predicted phage terminase large subunit-like protein
VVSLPAICEEPVAAYDWREPGEALLPERFDLEALNRIRSNVGGYDWQALYQQDPRLPEGNVFKRGWVTLVEKTDVKQAVRFWDLAASSKKTADYSVGVKMAITPAKRWAVLDVVRMRAEWPEVRKAIIETAKADGTGVPIGIEKAGFQLAVIQELLRERELWSHHIHGIPVDADKKTRFLPFAARAEEGLVDVLDRSWTAAYLSELCDFPFGGHDDQVDATSGAYGMLATSAPAPKVTWVYD